MTDPLHRLERRGEAGFSLVELLVTILVMGMVSAAITSAVLSAERANQFQRAMQDVMDDGRLSLNRIRQELRGGRRVLTGSTVYHLYWWVDNNQDGIQQPSELVHFCSAPLTSTTCATTTVAGQFQLIRWTDDDPTAIRRVAETLTTTEVFGGLIADDVGTPSDEINTTKVVTITLDLEVLGGRGPEEVTMSADVRLRNVE